MRTERQIAGLGRHTVTGRQRAQASEGSASSAITDVAPQRPQGTRRALELSNVEREADRGLFSTKR